LELVVADTDKVVPPHSTTPEISPEEQARRLGVEAERWAGLSVAERVFYLETETEKLARKYNVEPDTFKAMVEAKVKDNARKAQQELVAERQREERAEKQRNTEQKRVRKEADKERKDADKEAKRKESEREKEFAALVRLPSVEWEPRLVELARRLGEDPEFIRTEFENFVAVEVRISDPTYVEPWEAPVELAVLLSDIRAQLRRYVVIHNDDAVAAVVLWICFAWLHADIATHSPILTLGSGDSDAGKTTLCGVLKFLTPRAYAAAELTAASLYRFVDKVQPTLIVDDADRLLPRKPDLAHVINVGWTRDTKIPRIERGITHWFSPFCPKIVAGAALLLPQTTATRCINITLLPKLPSEKVADFAYADDDTFVTLRRKLTRFARDHAAALKEAKPVVPVGFNNRLWANWKLLLAVAELAGGEWVEAARKAAVKLTRQRREPSEGKRLLAATRDLFAAHGAVLTSNEVQSSLTADGNGEWAEFRGRGPISKRQIAVLLAPYGIHPDVVHPRGRPADRGYKVEWFEQAFRHYLPKSPRRKRTSVREPANTPQK